MSYLITCRKCQFTITVQTPNQVNFCAGCGGFLRLEPAEGEQAFHLPGEGPDLSKANKNIVDINDLLKSGTPLPDNINKALNECAEILKEIKARNTSNRDETDEMLDKIARDAKKLQKAQRLKDEGKWPSIEREEFADILSDEKWFQKLKDIK